MKTSQHTCTEFYYLYSLSSSFIISVIFVCVLVSTFARLLVVGKRGRKMQKLKHAIKLCSKSFSDKIFYDGEFYGLIQVYACRVVVCCSKLSLEKAPSIRQVLSGYLSEALDNAPSLVILDDLDCIISSSTDSEGSQPSSLVTLAEFLTDIMDEYRVLIHSWLVSLFACEWHQAADVHLYI